MARSSHIYIAQGCAAPLAAFTVKHEAQEWITKRQMDMTKMPPQWVIRIPDGGGDDARVYTAKEFLEA